MFKAALRFFARDWVRVMKKIKTILSAILSICACFQLCDAAEGFYADIAPEINILKQQLSFVRADDSSEQQWQRTIKYIDRKYDFRNDSFHEENKEFFMPSKPMRIISHPVGVAEILWSICPRERIVGFNNAVTDPKISFIAEEITDDTKIFSTQQTELIIGLQPDIVFTAFYSDDTFKTKLKQTGLLNFDIGYFGDIESIKEQILLIGDIIGEKNNAIALVKIIDETIEGIKEQIPENHPHPHILYYAQGGYVPGRATSFNSICSLIGAVNVGTEMGISSWAQVDYETLLKHNPDIIILPAGNGNKKLIKDNPLLSHADAIKKNRVYSIDPVYMGASSQFILLTAKILLHIAYSNEQI